MSKRKYGCNSTDEDSDDDEGREANARHFFHGKRWPNLLLHAPETLNPAFKGKTEARLRLELDLCLALRSVYLQEYGEVVFSIAGMCPSVVPYRCVARIVDVEGGHRHCGYRVQSDLCPLPTPPNEEEVDGGGPHYRARRLRRMDVEGAVVHATWIRSHLLFVSPPAKFDLGVAMVERAAMTLTKVAFMLRSATLALAKDMGAVGDALAADARALAKVKPAPRLQPLSRRFDPLDRIPAEDRFLEGAKSEARLAFEDEVIGVLDWRIASAHPNYHYVTEVMVSVTGEWGRLPVINPAAASNAPGVVNLRSIELSLMQGVPTPEALADALMAARGMEEAGAALLCAVRRLRSRASSEP